MTEDVVCSFCRGEHVNQTMTFMETQQGDPEVEGYRLPHCFAALWLETGWEIGYVDWDGAIDKWVMRCE